MQKVITTQYGIAQGTVEHNTNFMGNESVSRKRNKKARFGRESNTRREDSQGKVILTYMTDPVCK